MTLLDKRIEDDLKELYSNGLNDLTNRFNLCKIEEADKLSEQLFGEKGELSSHGLPGYFTGNRGARTVMVMLNPREDVAGKDNPGTTQKTISLLRIKNNDQEKFIETYKSGNANFGKYDMDERKTKGEKPDDFDLKQAAFLMGWPHNPQEKEFCGVEIPEEFTPDITKLKDINYGVVMQTIENVLTKKLQLELVPYASRKFQKVKNIDALFPYVDILFDEIFSDNYKGEDPRYVIFCSAYFEKLFMSYKGAGSIGIDIKNKKEKDLYEGKNSKPFKASCLPIAIHYKNNKPIKAIIAHTFPSQALPKAYDLMMKYGNFCYEKYKEYIIPNGGSVSAPTQT